ncbi:hypothetical protein C8N35_1011500 [Breoghania corrubedonensis]|uniref:Uncharacterized protein n=1 Tax=Breoghania corrubedonensis TaxID=665038 RepID=A0A2T5VIA4_9HYPH|nr:hypothetical protein [Breoghania corrubedonensis]PTW63446.1 hypothetical protein C8N35_1011500 [Breoghania corrubedonensis]
MQITGAGPTVQRQFDFDTKIEKQGSSDLQTNNQQQTAQAASANAASQTNEANESSPVEAASDSSSSNAQERSENRQRGVGQTLDISV